MDSSTIDSKSRCFILELPPEIRVMIYKEPLLLQSPRMAFLTIGKSHGNCNVRTAALTAITRVSHQIRQEAIPVLCRGLEINVEPAMRSDQRAVYQWLANVGSAVVQAVRRITIEPKKRCVCGHAIFLDDLQNPVEVFRDDLGYSHSFCDDLTMYNGVVQEIIDELEILGDERRVLTKYAMESLLDLLCGMVAEQAE